MNLFLRAMVVSAILLGIGYIFVMQVRFKRLAENERLERFKDWVTDKGGLRIVKWFGVIVLFTVLILFARNLIMEYNKQEELSRRETNQELINELSKVPSGQLVPNSLLSLVPNDIDQCRFQFEGSSVEYGRNLEGDRVEKGDTLVVEWEPSWVPEEDIAFGVFALADSFGNIQRWRVIQYGEKTRISFEKNEFLIFRGIFFDPQTNLKVLNTCSFETIKRE